jgi:hypothetical protein
MLDEVIDMMKESAKKKGDSAALQALEPPMRISDALAAMKAVQQKD